MAASAAEFFPASSRRSALACASLNLKLFSPICVFAAAVFCAPVKADEAPEKTQTRGYTVDGFARALNLAPIRHLLRPAAFTEHNSVFLETNLGEVALRYPDAFASSLKRPPAEIIRQAWQQSADFLERAQFPEEIRRASFGWNVLVANRLSAEAADSKVSSEYCHTALMGPPADILIDSYRLFHPCGVRGLQSPDERLVRTLIHEVGHAVEYKLLGEAFGRRQRWHSEGFASWFETEAATGARAQEAKSEMIRRARLAFSTKWKPYLFSGSPGDYAQSYAMFAVIAETQSFAQLQAVYRRMAADRSSFSDAVQRELGWSFDEWLTRTAAFLKV